MTFHRSPKHVFPGLKKALNPMYLESQKSLYQQIIKGKEKVSSFRDLLAEKKRIKTEQEKPRVQKRKPASSLPPSQASSINITSVITI